jgi:hypothetical protein
VCWDSKVLVVYKLTGNWLELGLGCMGLETVWEGGFALGDSW